MVTPVTILSISMPHHCTICFFQSHCNILCNVIGIYRWKIFFGIFMDELYRQFNYVGNYVCKNLYVITLFDFFIHFIPIVIPSSYTDNILLLIFADRFSDEKIKLVNITVIYR
jgi:hypothetical protein